MKDQYKFTVIIALTELEEHFEEAVASVIEQTIGFQANIQLILADISGEDEMEKLCIRYKSQYPPNVLYIKSNCSSLSDVRNMSWQHIMGKYVNFMDASNKWDINAFQNTYNFFEKYQDDIDLVSCRPSSLEASDKLISTLDYKYSKSGMLDINEKYSYIQVDMNTVFIKNNAFEGEFNDRSGFTQDLPIVTHIILKKQKYGLLREAVCYYREKRLVDSNINTSDKAVWFDMMQYGYGKLFSISKERYGRVVPYIQYLIMSDIQWRLRTPLPQNFSQEERELYQTLLTDILGHIDDNIIWEQKAINFVYKIFAMELKYGEKILQKAEVRRGELYYNKQKVFSIKSKHCFKIDILQVKDRKLILSGTSSLSCLGDRCKIYVSNNKGKRWPIYLNRVAYGNKLDFTGQTIYHNTGFQTKVQLNIGETFQFIAEIDGIEVLLKPNFGIYGKFNHEMSHSYYAHNDYILKYQNKKIKCLMKSSTTHAEAEFRYLQNLIFKRAFKIIFYRLGYHWNRKFKKKPIWIISDRTDAARDNGESFFRYLNETKAATGLEIYYVLDKACVDVPRLRQYGKVLTLDSLRYRMKFLIADKIIFSQASKWTQNAFGQDRDFVKDLSNFNTIFLQHGIIKDDFSSWLHKLKQNIEVFVTSVQREKESIVQGGYGYTEEEVVLTGLPRFDALENHAKKHIVICPTWRKKLASRLLPGTSIRPYQKDFKNSEYFQFYNRLINDPELIQALDDHGYSAAFYLHPCFKAQAEDFERNNKIEIVSDEIDYSRIFSEGSLMVTDYSSVYFDFAYLKKPVVYTMFDYQEYYSTHTCERGYFDYEEDGFGPCCYDYKSSIKAIISNIENGCIMKVEYRERVDNFFEWTDKKNCQRVYEAIVSREKSK